MPNLEHATEAAKEEINASKKWIIADDEDNMIVVKASTEMVKEKVADFVRCNPHLKFTVYEAVERYTCQIPVEFTEIQ